MSVVFVGDISYPFKNNQKFDFFKDKKIVGNLEGPIVDLDNPEFIARNNTKYNLYCIDSVVDFLEQLNIEFVSLANNHICDFRKGLENTKNILQKNHINYFGTVEKPYCKYIDDNKINYYIIGTATELTGAKNDRVYNYNYFDTLTLIKKIRKLDSGAKIIVYIHWGYELSFYPQPADRAWARQAIEKGATLIIGHHPHVVQGVELYKNGIIAYSLGNFYLPQTKYLDKILQYKDFRVSKELGIELNSLAVENSNLYWFQFDSEKNTLYLNKVEKINESLKIKKLTPFYGLSNYEYSEWFKKQCKLNKGTPKIYPTFYSYSNRFSFTIKNNYIKLVKIVRNLLIKLGFHKPWIK